MPGGWAVGGIAVLGGILGAAAVLALPGGVLFGCAGRADLPWFWAYLATWASAAFLGSVASDPTLTKERIRPGPGGEDYWSALGFVPLWASQHGVAGLDVGRLHWSDTVPAGVQGAALLGMAAGLGVVVWAMAVNRFFSSVVRIQTERGHRLVASGPYRYVRHPAYAMWPFLFVGGGIALGSWLAALPGVLIGVLVLRRTAREDRVLRERLESYAAYADEVRFRLLPGLW